MKLEGNGGGVTAKGAARVSLQRTEAAADDVDPRSFTLSVFDQFQLLLDPRSFTLSFFDKFQLLLLLGDPRSFTLSFFDKFQSFQLLLVLVDPRSFTLSVLTSFSHFSCFCSLGSSHPNRSRYWRNLPWM